MGAMAGTVDLVQRCYLGIETRDDVIWFEPAPPHRGPEPHARHLLSPALDEPDRGRRTLHARHLRIGARGQCGSAWTVRWSSSLRGTVDS